jgi:hypothetical protein
MSQKPKKQINAAPKPEPSFEEHMQDLVRRSHAGDRSTQPAIKLLLEGPAGPQIAEGCGNLARQIETLLLADCARGNLLVEAAARSKVEALLAEVAGPNPTPLERLLAERVVSCWLQVHAQDAPGLRPPGNALCQQRHRRKSAAHGRAPATEEGL